MIKFGFAICLELPFLTICFPFVNAFHSDLRLGRHNFLFVSDESPSRFEISPSFSQQLFSTIGGDSDYKDGSADVVDDIGDDNDPAMLECAAPDDNVLAGRYKSELLQFGASYGRGFGASPGARQRAEQVIEDLEELNPEFSAARGIDGQDQLLVSPLKGNWRLIWTTAADVLVLEASPLFACAAIYQVFESEGVVMNVIDLQPRAQSLIPPAFDKVNSLVRAKVITQASPRKDYPNRVGLDFKSVELKPIQLLGMDTGILPPIGFDWPNLPQAIVDVFVGKGGGDQDRVGGSSYFDVTYLDNDFLITRQNGQSGIFVFVRVDSLDP